MRKLLTTLAAAALLAGAAGAAGATEGWYGRADVGYSVEGEVEAEFFDGETSFTDSADLDDDWMADIGVGYGYANGFRSELELAYRNNDIAGTS
jgi:opacity protein-like surface antigen